MFEDSLIASGFSVERTKSARRMRSIALTSVGVQAAVLTAFIVAPMIWPDKFPLVSVAPKVAMISLKKPEIKIPPKPVRVTIAPDTAVHAPSAAPQVRTVEARGGGIVSHSPSTAEAMPDVPSLYHGGGMSGTPSLGIGPLMGSGMGPAVVAAAPKRTEPLTISSGVSKGLLLAPIQPIYPRIAVAARIEGTVVVTAIIDKQGHITGLRVVSGPEMLKQAAADAIKEARYHPYLLNGQPTDVMTTISVTFRMGG
jgi:protein TonB